MRTAGLSLALLAALSRMAFGVAVWAQCGVCSFPICMLRFDQDIALRVLGTLDQLYAIRVTLVSTSTTTTHSKHSSDLQSRPF